MRVSLMVQWLRQASHGHEMYCTLSGGRESESQLGQMGCEALLSHT